MEGMVGRAVRDKLMLINLVNIRDFATDKHHTTDDKPYGGGPGQLMKVEPLAAAVRTRRKAGSHVVFLTPQGKPFTTARAQELAQKRHLILVCGRYEGVDQRFRDAFVDEEISIGDYVLTGGELAAMVVMDAVSRFVPGVLGNNQSAEKDSFSNGLLEHPQYTKPREFEGMVVPEVLLAGHHAKIVAWQEAESAKRTEAVRPDLVEGLKKDEESREKLGKKS